MGTKIHKFIDEAGDPNFFGKGGVVIIGNEGVSKTFSLGMVSIKDEFKYKSNNIDDIRNKIKNLAQSIETNPYYATISSVKKRITKYDKFVFHAKDDIPEIRKEFFDLILELPFSFQCVVARKIPKLFIKKHNKKESEFYADLLAHLLRDKVHKNLVLNIAQLKRSTNEVNLELAIDKATAKYIIKNGSTQIKHNIVYNVQSYKEEPLLSITDYCLWAVQRVFEKGETKFYDYLMSKKFQVCDIYDFDAYTMIDPNNKKIWKNFYNSKNPLTKDNKISPSSS